MITKYGTNPESRTMGVASSRKVLLSSREPGEGQRNSNWYLSFIPETNRLVRDKLCEEVQHSIHSKGKVCDSVSIVQESSKSVQQEDVRPLLSLQENQV